MASMDVNLITDSLSRGRERLLVMSGALRADLVRKPPSPLVLLALISRASNNRVLTPVPPPGHLVGASWPGPPTSLLSADRLEQAL